MVEEDLRKLYTHTHKTKMRKGMQMKSGNQGKYTNAHLTP